MTQRVCNVEGCFKPHNARGLCAMHYSRQRRENSKYLQQQCDYMQEYNKRPEIQARNALRHKSKTRQKYMNTYQKERRTNDPNFKISSNLRSRLSTALRRHHKRGSAVRDLGCSIDELWEHLAIKFEVGMTKENYGEWHLDHIRPLTSFDLTDKEQFLIAVHYTNLQPLWAADNKQKGAKYV